MTAPGRGVEGRPGCLAGRLLGAVTRIVLVYPLISVGSQLGQAGETALFPGLGTPYEGALLGALAGIVIGLGLVRGALEPEGWRAQLADATLVLVCVLWLAAVVAGLTGRVGMADVIVPWGASLAGAAGIAGLLRA